MHIPPVAARSLGLLLGYAADLAFGDPRRGHPVAGFGTAAAALEQHLYADRRVTGVAHVAVAVGVTVVAAGAAEWISRDRPLLRTVLTAGCTWAVLGGRSLRREAQAVDGHLRCGDLPAAREQITHLVGRNPDSLDADGIARACVESVAENTSDAVVGPLFWGAVAGLPGLAGYRAINTLDAMVGHRSPRYRNFGWAAARLDDGVNLLPARVSAVIVGALAPSFGGSVGGTARIVRRDAGKHPSPNAGPVEAAFAAALGVRLGGVNSYGDAVEDRGTLGDGSAPRLADIGRAARLSGATSAVAVALAAVASAAIGAVRRQR
jgi:adenosylcobinamide-phosphate synthase